MRYYSHELQIKWNSIELGQKLYAKHPEPWSAEQPSLYRYHVEIREEAGSFFCSMPLWDCRQCDTAGRL